MCVLHLLLVFYFFVSLSFFFQHWDAGHTSFMAMLYLDFFYNAPITSTLAYNLSAAMYHRRELKQIADADMVLVVFVVCWCCC